MTRRRDRQSQRLRGYDYTTAGAYFVTICTRERQCSLEDTVWQMVVRAAWRRAVCGGTEPPSYDFVIMPNHVHGIVWLPTRPNVRLRPGGVGAQRPGNNGLVVDGVALVGERRSEYRGRCARTRTRTGGQPRRRCACVQVSVDDPDQPSSWRAGRCRLAARLLRSRDSRRRGAGSCQAVHLRQSGEVG